MLQRVRLIQAIGKFDQMSAAANIELTPLTLVYAENARGKTTVVSILRSLSTGDPLPIQERKRLGGTKESQVVLTFADEQSAIVFQNGSWNKSKPTIAIFDEQFINDNVYSGLIVDTSHREGLHGLIVGEQGVSLLRALRREVDAVEEHNQRLRDVAAAIHPKFLRGLTIDQFCRLPSVDNIEVRIEEARKAVSAARQQESIVRIRDLFEIQVPQIDDSALAGLLSEALPGVSAEAEKRIADHLAKLGSGGESWIAQGHRIEAEHRGELHDQCPYCAQPLSGSELASAYADHFSASYEELKAKIHRAIARLKELFGGSELLRLAHEENTTKFLFWKEFAELPELTLDVESVVGAVERASEELTRAFEAKAGSPLELLSLPTTATAALDTLKQILPTVDAYNAAVRQVNEKAAQVREAIQVASPTSLREELNKLEATQSRQDKRISEACEKYSAELEAKKQTEARRAAAKRALDKYLQQAFPEFQDAINLYLRRLNAGFRIEGVRSLNTRRGPSCVYNLVLDDCPENPIPVNADTVGRLPSKQY